MSRGSWLRYTAGMPEVRIEAASGQRSVGPLQFIVDTGATMSFLPRVFAGDLRQLLDQQTEQKTGLKDASGNPLTAVQLEVEIRLLDIPLFPVTTEKVWISRGLTFSLLGQTWLKKVGAHFQNFPMNPKGPRFALYRSPYGGQ